MLGLITAALGVVGKSLDKFPDWDDKKKADFYKMKEEFYEEAKKPLGLRDDERVVDLGDQLQRYVEAFRTVLESRDS